MSQRFRIISFLGLFLLLLLPLTVNASDDLEWHGRITNRPTAPEQTGTWEIGGLLFEATAATKFDVENGPLDIDACASVDYYVSDGKNIATEIDSEDDSKCANTGDDGDDPVKEKFYGLIQVIPTDPYSGTWVIGGGEFLATADTKLDDEDYDFAVDVCAEVEFFTDQAGNNVATGIETADRYHCLPGSYTNEVYGRIDSFPSDLLGTWMIDGMPYQTGPETKFEQEHGDFAEGVCVKVKFYVENGVKNATKIDSEDDNDCSGDGSASLPGESKVYATIDVGGIPAGGTTVLSGTWIIGGVEYEATPYTEYKQEDGPFVEGACVQVEYVVVDDQRLIKELGTEEAYKCQASGGGSALFKSYGVIEAYPQDTPGYTGPWQVSGIEYEADANTKFEQAYGPFAIGAYVEVKYTTVGTANLALEIETHVAPGAGNNSGTGNLDDFNSDDYWDDWTIDGVTYVADPAITVVEDDEDTGRLRRLAAPVVGDKVVFNSYRALDGTRYLTYVAAANQVFLSVISR